MTTATIPTLSQPPLVRWLHLWSKSSGSQRSEDRGRHGVLAPYTHAGAEREEAVAH